MTKIDHERPRYSWHRIYKESQLLNPFWFIRQHPNQKAQHKRPVPEILAFSRKKEIEQRQRTKKFTCYTLVAEWPEGLEFIFGRCTYEEKSGIYKITFMYYRVHEGTKLKLITEYAGVHMEIWKNEEDGKKYIVPHKVPRPSYKQTSKRAERYKELLPISRDVARKTILYHMKNQTGFDERQTLKEKLRS